MRYSPATTVLRNGLILATALVLPALARAQQTTPKAYALVHAKIFTLAGAPVENGTLIIRDGKIAAVGGQVEVPQDAQVINGEGLQIYPGMFDPITQMGLREIGAVGSTVDTTESGNYNPDVVALTAISPSSEHIAVTRVAGITEVLAVPASGGMDSFGPTGVIGGQASAIYLAGWTVDDMQLKRSVAMVVNWPEIQTKTFGLYDLFKKGKALHGSKAGIRQTGDRVNRLDCASASLRASHGPRRTCRFRA